MKTWEAISTLLGMIVCFALGWVICAARMETSKRNGATAKPAIVQKDGSIVAERNPTRPHAAPPQIPTGATLTRIVEVELKLSPLAMERGAVSFQVATIEMDAGIRSIVKSDSGEIVAQGDWVIAPRHTTVERWAIGPSYRTGAGLGLSGQYRGDRWIFGAGLEKKSAMFQVLVRF